MILPGNNGDDETEHPAQFPEELPHDHIISWSNSGDVVLDPMCGSGTTLKMAKELGRLWIGIDISQEYCNIAQKRVDGARVPMPGLEQTMPTLPPEQMRFPDGN
jgi:site-specific DNA-methyltransferase (adenine-specific)